MRPRLRPRTNPRDPDRDRTFGLATNPSLLRYRCCPLPNHFQYILSCLTDYIVIIVSSGLGSRPVRAPATRRRPLPAPSLQLPRARRARNARRTPRCCLFSRLHARHIRRRGRPRLRCMSQSTTHSAALARARCSDVFLSPRDDDFCADLQQQRCGFRA